MINGSLLAMLRGADAVVQLMTGRSDGVYPEVLSAGLPHARVTPTERAVLMNYRVLCVFAAIAFPLFLMIARVFDLPRNSDFLAVRVAGSVSFLTLLALSYIPGFRRWFIRGVRAILFLFAGWIVYLTWYNRFSVDFIISLMMVVSGIGFLMSSRRSFVVFACFTTLAVGVALYNVTDPAVHPVYLFSCIAGLNLFLYLILNTRLAVIEGLIQGEELRQVFVDHSSEAFLLFDPINRRVMEYNRNARDLFSITDKVDDETIIADVFGQSEWRNIDAALVIKDCISLGEYRRIRAYLTRSGRSFWGDLSAIQIRMGRRHFVLVRVADVTARKQLEDRLSSAETHFRLVEEKTTDVLSRIKPDGTILKVSPSCRALYGLGQSELVGRNVFEFMLPSHAVKAKDWFATDREEVDHVSSRYQLIRGDGSGVWIETTTRKVRDPATNAVREIDSVVRDITDRVDMETGIDKV